MLLLLFRYGFDANYESPQGAYDTFEDVFDTVLANNKAFYTRNGKNEDKLPWTEGELYDLKPANNSQLAENSNPQLSNSYANYHDFDRYERYIGHHNEHTFYRHNEYLALEVGVVLILLIFGLICFATSCVAGFAVATYRKAHKKEIDSYHTV